MSNVDIYAFVMMINSLFLGDTNSSFYKVFDLQGLIIEINR